MPEALIPERNQINSDLYTSQAMDPATGQMYVELLRSTRTLRLKEIGAKCIGSCGKDSGGDICSLSVFFKNNIIRYTEKPKPHKGSNGEVVENVFDASVYGACDELKDAVLERKSLKRFYIQSKSEYEQKRENELLTPAVLYIDQSESM